MKFQLYWGLALLCQSILFAHPTLKDATVTSVLVKHGRTLVIHSQAYRQNVEGADGAATEALLYDYHLSEMQNEEVLHSFYLGTYPLPVVYDVVSDGESVLVVAAPSEEAVGVDLIQFKALDDRFEAVAHDHLPFPEAFKIRRLLTDIVDESIFIFASTDRQVLLGRVGGVETPFLIFDFLNPLGKTEKPLPETLAAVNVQQMKNGNHKFEIATQIPRSPSTLLINRTVIMNLEEGEVVKIETPHYAAFPTGKFWVEPTFVSGGRIGIAVPKGDRLIYEVRRTNHLSAPDPRYPRVPLPVPGEWFKEQAGKPGTTQHPITLRLRTPGARDILVIKQTVGETVQLAQAPEFTTDISLREIHAPRKPAQANCESLFQRLRSL